MEPPASPLTLADNCPVTTSPHLTSPHLTSPHLTSPRLALPRLASPRLASPSLAKPRLEAGGFSQSDQRPIFQNRGSRHGGDGVDSEVGSDDGGAGGGSG
ncbi:exported repetitive protein [Lasius niger]|uniref:Exported repetitive protein n=1 Tax=Lasius niger TaxID=67767 RepID=A0A0J7MR41_LASNI|nr:exported repetitive protein [Lasius niger]